MSEGALGWCLGWWLKRTRTLKDLSHQKSYELLLERCQTPIIVSIEALLTHWKGITTIHRIALNKPAEPVRKQVFDVAHLIHLTSPILFSILGILTIHYPYSLLRNSFSNVDDPWSTSHMCPSLVRFFHWFLECNPVCWKISWQE